MADLMSQHPAGNRELQNTTIKHGHGHLKGSECGSTECEGRDSKELEEEIS